MKTKPLNKKKAAYLQGILDRRCRDYGIKRIKIPSVLLRNYPKGTKFWFLHHGQMIETTYYLYERLSYVVREKPTHELRRRLAAMRPCKNQGLDSTGHTEGCYAYDLRGLLAAYKKEYPNHPRIVKGAIQFPSSSNKKAW